MALLNMENIISLEEFRKSKKSFQDFETEYFELLIDKSKIIDESFYDAYLIYDDIVYSVIKPIESPEGVFEFVEGIN